jgi:nucleotidyltransferase AbiEii toxin of type IV toxin-antitoxin system
LALGENTAYRSGIFDLGENELDGIAIREIEFRRRLFEESGHRMNLDPFVVEKDFWVCWTLYHLFEITDLQKYLIFRGGTSLSKVFNVIHRFSEDVDLTLDRRLLGFIGDKDPAEASSNRTRQILIDEMIERYREYIADIIKPQLIIQLSSCLGKTGQPWELVMDESDESGFTFLFRYPMALVPQSGFYIEPSVKLEFGCRADPWPTINERIKPYAADMFPDVFKLNPSAGVVAVRAERTFWEKATILHQEAHRPQNKEFPARYSRHYYDLAMLAKSFVRQTALSDLALLENVARHKKLFFRCGWAKYDEATPGSLRLMPPPGRRRDILKDYKKMQVMIFREPPSFEEILDILFELEENINKP